MVNNFKVSGIYANFIQQESVQGIMVTHSEISKKKVWIENFRKLDISFLLNCQVIFCYKKNESVSAVTNCYFTFCYPW